MARESINGKIFYWTSHELTVRSVELFCEYLMKEEGKSFDYALKVYREFADFDERMV